MSESENLDEYPLEEEHPSFYTAEVLDTLILDTKERIVRVQQKINGLRGQMEQERLQEEQKQKKRRREEEKNEKAQKPRWRFGKPYRPVEQWSSFEEIWNRPSTVSRPRSSR